MRAKIILSDKPCGRAETVTPVFKLVYSSAVFAISAQHHGPHIGSGDAAQSLAAFLYVIRPQNGIMM